MELTGVKDIWGNEYTDTFQVSFTMPEGESGGNIDDTPSSDGGSSNIDAGEITIGSSNTSYHGHGFYTVEHDAGSYEAD